MEFGEILKYSLVFLAFVILALGIVLGGGTLRDKMNEVKSVAIRFTVYSILDYGFMFLSIVFVAIMKRMDANIVITTILMWILDFALAYALLVICLKSKQDLTLGRQYRKGYELIREKSRNSGFISLAILVVKGVVWDGPEKLVEFWHKQLASNKSRIIVLIAASLFQAIFWTVAYWLGLELI